MGGGGWGHGEKEREREKEAGYGEGERLERGGCRRENALRGTEKTETVEARC